jgi:hypothetical protein
LQPANKEAGKFLERLLKGVFEAGDRREGIKTTAPKKLQINFRKVKKFTTFAPRHGGRKEKG